MNQTNLTPGKTFAAGVVAGFFVLCTIGFFIMLAVYFGGNSNSAARAGEGEDVTEAYPEKFSECLDSDKYAAAVKSDMQLGASLGVQGTPASFINGYFVSGALPYNMMKQVVDALLAGEEPNFDFMKNQEGEIVKVDMPDLPDVEWRGNKNAGISVVTWSDFECPYCARFVSTIDQLLDEYSNDVRFTFRHFPLSFHAQAQKAAEAYECAKEQGKTYEMHDELFDLASASQLGVENFKKAAADLELE